MRRLSPAFLAAVILFVAPATVALTTYPPYYEDESWIYLAPFEALRGNGFSWAAFHEGTSSAGVFNALAFFFVRISPFAAEATVRLTSLLFALAAIAGVFAAARKVAGANAAIASTLLMLAPMWFLPVRYGRLDVLAIAFAMWAVAAAASEAYFVAGVLSGLSMGVHPVFVWIGPVCALIVFQRGGLRSVWRYVLGGLAGAAPQLAWMAIHFHDFQSIAARYFVASGVGKGWTASVANEWTRYRAYAKQLTGIDMVAQAIGFVVLPAVAIVVAPRRERLVLSAIALVPLAGLAMLVGGKNPYYLIYALPFLAVVAAASARWLPLRWIEGACLAALIAAAVRYAPAIREAAKAPSVTQEVEQIASRLPANAVVFSPAHLRRTDSAATGVDVVHVSRPFASHRVGAAAARRDAARDAIAD